MASNLHSGPTVLLMLDRKEVYHGAGFIDLEQLEHKIERIKATSLQLRLPRVKRILSKVKKFFK